MTVTTTAARQTHTGNGSTVTFSFPQKFLEDDDLTVTVAGVTQVLNSDYTISGSGPPYESGGNVVFTSPPADQAAIVIIRVTGRTQDLNLTNTGDFDQEGVEDALDKNTLQVQEAIDTAAQAASDAADDVLAQVQDLVDDAEAARDAAQTAETNAETAETNAETAETNAEPAQTAAETARDKAEDWADEDFGTEVEAGQYSGKHWSEQARRWAENATDSEPDATNFPGEFSSKHYALESKAWAVTAEDVEPDSTNFPGEYSARHWAAKAEAEKDALIGTLTGNLIDWNIETASFNPVSGARTKVDSSGGSITAQLASSPVVDTHYEFTEADGVDWSVDTWIIDPNGNKVNGVAGNFTVSTRSPFKVIWKGATDGYELQYYFIGSSGFEDRAGNFSAVNGGKYQIDEGAQVTLPTAQAGVSFELRPKPDQDLSSVQATILNGAVNIAGEAVNYNYDENGHIQVYCDDGTNWEIELLGVVQVN